MIFPIYFKLHLKPLKGCCHNQKEITRWYQFDWLLCNMKASPIQWMNNKPSHVIEVRGARFWLYTLWGAFHVDLLIRWRTAIPRTWWVWYWNFNREKKT